MTWTWTPFTTGVGWLIALIVGLCACIFWAQGSLPKEAAMLIIAVCAIRL